MRALPFLKGVATRNQKVCPRHFGKCGQEARPHHLVDKVRVCGGLCDWRSLRFLDVTCALRARKELFFLKLNHVRSDFLIMRWITVAGGTRIRGICGVETNAQTHGNATKMMQSIVTRVRIGSPYFAFFFGFSKFPRVRAPRA